MRETTIAIILNIKQQIGIMRKKTTRHKTVNAIIIVVGVLLAVYIAKECNDINKADNKAATEKAYRMNMRKKYSIIKKDKVGETVKASIEVKLNKRIGLKELEELGKFIKEDEAKYFKIAYIGYYLDELGYSNGYWATTHYTPHLEVWISNK